MPRDEYICTPASTNSTGTTLTPDVNGTQSTADIDTITIAGSRIDTMFADNKTVRVIIEH